MSSKTSSSDLVNTMTAAVTYLYQIGGPIFIVIGNIGSILNLIVFTQKTLRKNPCSIYFIAYNAVNFLYMYGSLLSLTLDIGYHIDPSIKYLSICRLRIYIAILLNVLSPCYLILASIDRILITSLNALTRQRSTLRLAYTCTICITLFWILFHSHAIFMANITEIGPNYFLCYLQMGVYLALMGYYSIIKEILVLSLMIIFGLWAIRNIRSMQRVRPVPDLTVSRTMAEGTTQSTSSKDRQLMFMLFLDISIYASFSFVFAIFLLYQQITQYNIKTDEQTQIEVVIRNLCLLIIGIPFCTSCYTNLIASKTFRKEVKKILHWNRIFCIE